MRRCAPLRLRFRHLFVPLLLALTPLAHAQDVAVWITTADHKTTLAASTSARFESDAVLATPRIEVDDGERFQDIVGFGASLTDSSAWLIQHTLDPRQREALLNELFGRDGNGLGLWVSQGIVERYGGNLTAANRPEGGSCFTVWLRLEALG